MRVGLLPLFVTAFARTAYRILLYGVDPRLPALSLENMDEYVALAKYLRGNFVMRKAYEETLHRAVGPELTAHRCAAVNRVESGAKKQRYIG